MANHTIAICTKHRIDGVLDAVRSALDNPCTEVIVVDQNTDDRLVDLFETIDDDRLVHLRTPIAGAGRARNIALEHASTDYVCFTDDDCIVDPDYAERFEAALRADDRLALGFCRVEQGGDSADGGYVPVYDIDEHNEIHSWGRHVRPERLGIGAGLIVHRRITLDVGGFDPHMGPGGRFPSADDRELALRMLLAGHAIAATPSPVVQHYGHRPAGSAARALTKRDFVGLGAMMAKLVKVRAPGAVRSNLDFLGQAARQCVHDSIARRRPASVGKPVWALVGLLRGLQTPVDRNTVVYRIGR